MLAYSFELQYNPHPLIVPEFAQPGFFFNTPEHLDHQRKESFYVLTALNQRTGLADARCAFFLDDDRAISPVAAPFGSIEFTKALPNSVLDTFLYALTNAVRLAGKLSALRLIHYPCCYAPEQTTHLLEKLPRHGFQLVHEVQTFYLPINSHTTFCQMIAPAERRRLRKSREAGFQWRHWEKPNLTDVVNFIQQTRQQQGYRLTLRPDDLIYLLQRFPDQFPIFTLNDGSQLAALVVAVRVRDDILYTFLPASDPAYRTFSPMVMLLDGLYTYCQYQAIQILDLGTSLDGENQPKTSLMRFKRNLGALESPKFVFEKSL